MRILFVSVILTVVRATCPAWASGPTSNFSAEIIRTAEGHADVKWPTRKGGYYTLQYSISLEEIGWTDLFTAYAGSTSSPGNLATYTGVRVYNAPVPGTPPPASNVVNYAFSLRRNEGGQTIYTTGIPGGENGILVNNGASTTPVGPRQFFRIRESGVDSDGDGLLDWDEYTLGLNAFALDSNGDGISDAALDLDQDGVSNADEIGRGTDPNNVASFPPVWRTITRNCDYVFYTYDLPPNGQFTYGGDWSANLSVGSPEDISTALSLTNGMVNRLNSKVPFPVVSSIVPSPVFGNTGFSLNVASNAWFHNWPGQGPDGGALHARVWISRSPSAPIAVVRKAIKVTTTLTNDQLQTTSVAPVTFTVPANGTVSNICDLIPNHPYPSADFTIYTTREGLAELEAAPEVLRVNTDFDEGRLDLVTGFALDDASDEDLKADRDGPDGRIKTGEVVTEDLHSGWYGLNPNALWPSFYDGATVHFKKLNLTDPETGRPESGHVRLWVTQGSGTSGHAWAVKSYDFNTLQPVNLVGLVYGSTPTIPNGLDKKYWLEGVKPGRITLEFRYTKGALSFSHVSTLQVLTRQTMLEWKKEVDYQIALQTLDDTSPLPRFSSSVTLMPPTTQSYKNAIETVSEFYDYYRQLWVSSSGQVTDWSGMARIVANQVTAALIDQEYRSGWAGMRDLQTELMSGAQSIFRDIAWQHRAYSASGIGALRHVRDDEIAKGKLNAFLFDSWAALDTAIATGDSAGVAAANLSFLQREQFIIVQRHYDRIKAMKLVWVVSTPWVLDRMAVNPMPGGQMFLQVVPSGDLANVAQRWSWITLSLLPQWNSYTPAYRQALVQYRLFDRVPFYMWDPLAPPLVWDHQDKPVGGFQ